jgi:aspartyl-tRNA(Asn)/glutamyl-tRNA(Gln) amidotransferase subunit A
VANNKTDLCFLSIRDASGLIERRELSPVELTQAMLDRIDEIDGKVKSYTVVSKDLALKEARAAEEEIADGHYKGPLHGIPMAYKEQWDIAGFETRQRGPEFRYPTQDAAAVARLRKAGAPLLGKVAAMALAVDGDLEGDGDESKREDDCRNPWNLDYSPGGSSSGSGASVAAGLAMGSLGGDVGGSIRWPAAACGIVGLKATYGRISRDGLVSYSWSQDFGGPMTRTVEDTALMLQVIAGYDPKDLASDVPVPDYSSSLREDINGLVIGVPRDYITAPRGKMDPEGLEIFDKALKDMESLGARIEEISIPSLHHAVSANFVTWYTDSFSHVKKDVQSHPQVFGQFVRTLVRLGALFTSDDYVQAQRVRTIIRREFAENFKNVDLMLVPTTPKPHFAMNALEDDPNYNEFIRHGMDNIIYFLSPFNATGLPAMSIPSGFSSMGMPVGMQLVGKPFDEPTMLRAGYTYQQHAKWHQRRPQI